MSGNAIIKRSTTAEFRADAQRCEDKYAETGDVRFLESAGHFLLAAVNVYPTDPRVSRLARKDIRNMRRLAVSFLRSAKNATNQEANHAE